MRNSPIGISIASRLNRNGGLTLIELLVAITVLAFVAVLGWRGLDTIVRTRIALTSDLEQTRGIQLAFAQLQSDCAHLATPDILPGRSPLIVEPERLKLVRIVFAENQPSRLQIVTYQIRNGILTRHETHETRDLGELDRLWQNTAINTNAEGEVVLQSGVTTMSMRLWVNGGTTWRSGAEITQMNANLPGQAIQPPSLTGLEVSIQLREHSTGLLKIFLLGAV